MSRNGDPDVWMTDRISELKRRFRSPEQAEPAEPEPIFDLSPEEPEPVPIPEAPSIATPVQEPRVAALNIDAKGTMSRKQILCFSIDEDGGDSLMVDNLDSLLAAIRTSIETRGVEVANDENSIEFTIMPKWMTQEEYDDLPDG